MVAKLAGKTVIIIGTVAVHNIIKDFDHTNIRLHVPDIIPGPWVTARINSKKNIVTLQRFQIWQMTNISA